MRGHPLYVKLLASLREPQTVKALMLEHHVSPCMAYPFVVKMHNAGRLHIAGWQQLPGKRPLAMYCFGRRVDAPMPSRAPGGQKSRVKLIPTATKPGAHLTAFEYILRELEAGACTTRDVATACGIADDTARETLKALEAAGLAHIKTWHRPYKGVPVPAYVYGPGRRATRPRPIPKAVTQAKYEARAKEGRPLAALYARVLGAA